MRRALSRLRWQLTRSHLAAIAVTLVSMIAAVLVIASAWWTHSNDPSAQPVQAAHMVASGVSGLVRAVVAAPDGSPLPTELSTVLALIGSGQLSLASGPPVAAPDATRWRAPAGWTLPGLSYSVIVGRDGRVLGSSDASGASFAPTERGDWPSLAATPFAGAPPDTSQRRVLRADGQPVDIGAAHLR